MSMFLCLPFETQCKQKCRSVPSWLSLTACTGVLPACTQLMYALYMSEVQNLIMSSSCGTCWLCLCPQVCWMMFKKMFWRLKSNGNHKRARSMYLVKLSRQVRQEQAFRRQRQHGYSRYDLKHCELLIGNACNHMIWCRYHHFLVSQDDQITC